MTTIFISIAAYKDPQLLGTIESAISNANHPENLRFGIALQYNEDPDLSKYSNIKTISYNPDTRPGICRVRYNISNELYNNEDFYLQVDSHYQFARGWDTQLIDAYYIFCAEYNTSKIIILPLEIYGDEKMTSYFELSLEPIKHNMPMSVHPTPRNGREFCNTTSDEIPFGRVGQIFIPKSFIKDVGLDPFSQKTQEIAYFSYRAIMSGYKFVQLHKQIMWQFDADYQTEVWSDSTENTDTRFSSDYYKESPHTWYEMSLAYIYNDYSKYAIPNSELAPIDFWRMQGQEEEYLKARKYFDQILYSNLQ